ncbi:hypothetical protein TNCV_228541 [Trichonephila clavipes]|nr:hypothetical protein TNCV_228541 [Trichonephila clavipes]
MNFVGLDLAFADQVAFVTTTTDTPPPTCTTHQHEVTEVKMRSTDLTCISPQREQITEFDTLSYEFGALQTATSEFSEYSKSRGVLNLLSSQAAT